MTKGEQNLILLESLISRNDKFYVWCFAPDGTYRASSCPEEERSVLEQAFRVLGGEERIIRYAQDKENTQPLIIGSPIGMQWALSYESERDRSLIFVIGPVFYTQPRESQIRDGLHIYRSTRKNMDLADRLIGLLSKIPVISYGIFIRYVVMIHNTLTGQQLGLEDLKFDQQPKEVNAGDITGKRDRNRIWLAEQVMLQMVRTGNINYHKALQNSSIQSSGVPVHGKDPLRQIKTSIVVFTTLVSRAAMEGGLSPEIAYALGDSYLQSVEDCKDSGELSALAHAMYHDFIYRVHHVRTNPNYSHAIQKCCDYIELSLDRRIRTSDLAALVGYTEYYLTDKFKKETGQSVNSYIRAARVERAKMLLISTDQSVREISEQLSFNTVNYFIQSFRSVTGCTPAQYRKMNVHKN